ncbi:MAG: prepilin peptidase [Oscillospiraceae bacterium]
MAYILQDALIYGYFFLVGSCFGSFVNVVIYRVPRKISIVKGRSFCPKCGHPLTALDLFPVFSWLFLCRKCRYCKAPISARYPQVELLGGIFAVLCVWQGGMEVSDIFEFAAICAIIAIAFIDADTMEIPNGLILFLAAVAAFFPFLDTGVSLTSRLIGFVCISLPMFLLTMLIPGCFGGGDIKLIAVSGFILGWEMTLLASFVAILLGGGYAVYLLAAKKAVRKTQFAFGPFLCAGIIVSMFFGSNILSFYLGLFK